MIINSLSYAQYLRQFEKTCPGCGISVWYSSNGICDDCGSAVRGEP